MLTGTRWLWQWLLSSTSLMASVACAVAPGWSVITVGTMPPIRRRPAGALIGVLQDTDWDTEGESPEEFKDDPVIVEAFRQHGVILHCGAESDEGKWCELERGHTGEDHKDWRGSHWNSEATTDA